MKRILLTTDVVGGVWDFCLVLARELQAADHSVTLLALGSPTPAQLERAGAIGMELISAPLKLEWMQDSSGDVAATRALVASVAREINADVIHASQFAAACADDNTPVVLTVHSDVLSWRKWTLGTEAVPLEWHPYVQLAREALNRADEVVAVSGFLANEVQLLYGIARDVRVIHNGWPAVTPSAPKEPITLMAGRVWDAAKNVALVAEAAVGRVYLAGESKHPEGGQATIPAPLQPLGFLEREEMDAWLDRASIYLSPARYDPFGLLPLQAALRGCALLLSDIPSYREMWDGVATFFKPTDPGDLRRKWERLLRDPESRALERARSLFTPNRMLTAYERLYAAHAARVAA